MNSGPSAAMPHVTTIQRHSQNITLSSEQYSQLSTHGIFECNFMDENHNSLNGIAPRFVPKGTIDNMITLIRVWLGTK